jgi:hypothetical protein
LIPKYPWSSHVDEVLLSKRPPRELAQSAGTGSIATDVHPWGNTTIVSGAAVETRTRTS